MAVPALELKAFEENATGVARVLKALANERRLMILCTLAKQGEASVGALADAVGLSQSALSQHLGRMRDEGMVTFRREGQVMWYRIADTRIAQLLKQLEKLFCRAV